MARGYCQKPESETTFAVNLKLLFSYLPASSRTLWLPLI